MIVIPTYNGYHFLSRLIKALEKYGTEGHKVVIVDDKSNELISCKYLEQLQSYTGPLNLSVLRPSTKPGYEAGCLVTAIREYPEEETALLLQDTCLPTSDIWLKQFMTKLTPDNAVAWIRFRPALFFCFEKHLEYIKSICPIDDLPEGGFFGNIFLTYTSHLKKLDDRGYFDNLPTTKFHSEAWERIWAILLHRLGVKIDAIIEVAEGKWFDDQIANRIHFGHFAHLKKTFQGRAG